MKAFLAVAVAVMAVIFIGGSLWLLNSDVNVWRQDNVCEGVK